MLIVDRNYVNSFSSIYPNPATRRENYANRSLSQWPAFAIFRACWAKTWTSRAILTAGRPKSPCRAGRSSASASPVVMSTPGFMSTDPAPPIGVLAHAAAAGLS